MNNSSGGSGYQLTFKKNVNFGNFGNKIHEENFVDLEKKFF